MNIHFSNVNFSSSTGPNTFAHRLAEEFMTQGHEIVLENQNYDIFLAFIEPTSKPRPEAKFIQRLDGIWFKPDQFETHNRLIKWTYDNSDLVIWQSDFDRKMTTHHWGDKRGTIIRNGIKLADINIQDKQIQKLRKHYEKIFVCSSNWHPQKRLQDNIQLFKNFKKENPNSCLVIMGGHPDCDIDEPDIFYVGSVPHGTCLEFYSAADYMIHLAWLDHCPNVVVEALSQKCPVICTDSGGTAELVGDHGYILPEKIPYNFELLDYDSPPELDLSIDLSNPIEQFEIDHLSISQVAQNYLTAFNMVKK